MYQGSRERGGGAVRWPAVGATLVVAVAVVAVAVWSLFRGGGPGDAPGPTFSFELRSVTGVGVGGNTQDRALQRPARQVQSTIDGLYTAAFVDPAQWQERGFAGALSAFSGPAARRAREDLDDLTLGSTARIVRSVDPGPGGLAIRFLLDEGRPLAAVARTTFTATATLRQGGTLRIVHRGRYLLRRFGERWDIVGYDVNGRLRTPRTGPG
ncbi:MAG TPA: hypothetical protein VHL78_12135 [Actinomycetota bacterium]|nr:hypothetical protein [Actinomycetota bacterium]